MMQATDIAVRREITVDATPQRAFEVFTEGFDTWWPRSHTIGEAELDRVVIEPRAGGRWLELGKDGSECVWGEVLAYDPPNRLALTWHINGDWVKEEAASETEVTFTPAGGGATKVELAHLHLERHAAADKLREAVGS